MIQKDFTGTSQSVLIFVCVVCLLDMCIAVFFVELHCERCARDAGQYENEPRTDLIVSLKVNLLRGADVVIVLIDLHLNLKHKRQIVALMDKVVAGRILHQSRGMGNSTHMFLRRSILLHLEIWVGQNQTLSFFCGRHRIRISRIAIARWNSIENNPNLIVVSFLEDEVGIRQRTLRLAYLVTSFATRSECLAGGRVCY